MTSDLLKNQNMMSKLNVSSDFLKTIAICELYPEQNLTLISCHYC